MPGFIKAAIVAAIVIAFVAPALSYEQSESPENNGRNIQQVQPGPAPLLTQMFQARPARATQRSRATEEQFFQRASGNLW